MRFLEIGAGNCPSSMQFDSQVEYYGVDRTGLDNPGQNMFGCSIEDFSKACPDDLRFDYIFAANVLGNLLSTSDRYSVVRAAGGLVCEGGKLVFIEYLSPMQAEFRSFSQIVQGRVVFDASPEFRLEWDKHRPIDPKDMKSRLKLKYPFQMLVNNQ